MSCEWLCAVAWEQKLAQYPDKIWKSGQFCGSDFGSRFLATKMGSQIFLQKEIKRKSWATAFLVAVSGFPIW